MSDLLPSRGQGTGQPSFLRTGPKARSVELAENQIAELPSVQQDGPLDPLRRISAVSGSAGRKDGPAVCSA
ncbi:hypothetical protein VT52_021620 [Streptomyces malaysiense]|uniref:Uncharacterized protein n=1 Tax=Streptomyces malaysiense TaxID=1428626 RepID=A0A1J4Q073_9ACTN|nr:hypothetical protein VT52_021620 [Streptomyces malaysiense]